MASKYFSGSAPASYLPPGFMESATAPGRYYAEAMGSIGKAVGAGLAKRNQRKKDKAYFDFIERMGETPTTRTEMIPGAEMVERGRPLTDEASGDYFNDTMEAKDAYLRNADFFKGLQSDSNAFERLKAYAQDELPTDHPINEFIEGHEQNVADAVQLSTENVQRQFKGMVMDSIKAQTQVPDNVRRQSPGAVDPFDRLTRPDQQFNDLIKTTYNDSLKWAKEWEAGSKEMAAKEEKKLDDFMAGVDPKTGKKLMDVVPTETEVNVPLSLAERREIVTSDLAGMARSMGRERFKDARAEVDKLFPRQPELGVKEQGAVMIITEDGAYKAAMAKPKLQGNSLFEQLSEATQKLVPGLMDDVRKDPTIAKYIESYSALNIMKSAAGLQSGAGDLALITKFMKALDPESVVRETEMAAAQKTTSAFGVIQGIIGQLTTGQKLTNDQRKNIVEAAERLVNTSGEMAEFKVEDYREKGSMMGIPDKLFVPKLPGRNKKAQGDQDITKFPGFNLLTGEWEGLDNAPSN